LGIEDQINEEALWFSYEVINNFSIKKLNSKKLTFFTTGTVAKTVPSLLKKICEDGHEISSHYFYHDLMHEQDKDLVTKNLENAIEAIELSVGIRPKGFRAPAFSIPHHREDIFSILMNYFDYDSSFVMNLNNIVTGDYKKLDIFSSDSFKEFPIVPKSYLGGKLNIKSGGTYLRFFSKETIIKVMDYNVHQGFIPIIYLHPYDYLSDKEFWVDYKYFKKQKFFKGSINYLRQYQWLGTGNKSTLSKLSYILETYSHIGRMGYER